MTDETTLRHDMARLCRDLFLRGYVHGSAGNVSARLEDGFLVTPTNSCLGRLEPERISRIGLDGRHQAGDPASKEAPLHLACYAARAEARAIVHLHATHATALSCLAGTNREDALPAITPYLVMRVGRVPMVPYFRPGSAELAAAVGERMRDHKAVLMASHGFTVVGRSLEEAVFNAEEFEENAKLLVMLAGRDTRMLDAAQVSELTRTFG
jgi:ribulose-5-phosphate 4-epimerase/fuculose-1-phosphate aldolase